MPFSKSAHGFGLLALIVVLLTALMALQYRWIGELSDFQHQQKQRALRTSTERFVRDLEGELERVWYTFHVRRGRSAGEEIVDELGEWRASFEFPELVAEAYWVRETRDASAGGLAPDRRFDLQRVSLEDGGFEPLDWPAWLSPLLEPLSESANSHRGRELHESDNFTATLGEHGEAFVVAQTQIAPKSWAIVMLRRDVMVEQFLPSLVRAHFGAGEEREFEVQLVEVGDQDRVVFATAPGGSTGAAASPDLVRHLRDYGGFYRTREEGGGRSLAVAVTHTAGSLDTAVAQLRRRNLGFGFGVLLVLGASVAVLAVAARRARQLAERQMEFVAGVSHELRTPIAGISSLSQNLADGVVQDIDHAARYGEAIHQESRRLGNMVEGVLHFSAIRSGRNRYAMRELDIGDVTDKALAGLDRTAVEKAALQIEIDGDMPLVRGDERALQSVVRNLVSNAIKFGDEGGEITLSATTIGDAANPGIELRVEDRGPGIAASELSRVFEPFFRGKAARSGQVEGSGLGLSLVKEVVDAHGGEIDVASEPGRGTAFRIRLPACREAATDSPLEAAVIDMPATETGGEEG